MFHGRRLKYHSVFLAMSDAHQVVTVHLRDGYGIHRNATRLIKYASAENKLSFGGPRGQAVVRLGQIVGENLPNLKSDTSSKPSTALRRLQCETNLIKRHCSWRFLAAKIAKLGL